MSLRPHLNRSPQVPNPRDFGLTGGWSLCRSIASGRRMG